VEEDRELVPGLMPWGSWENWAGKSSSEAEGAGMVRRSSALENLDYWKSRDQCVQIHDGCLQRRGLNWAGADVVHGVQGTLEWAWFQVPGAVTGWLHWEKPVWLALEDILVLWGALLCFCTYFQRRQGDLPGLGRCHWVSSGELAQSG
jgi:hypothetical protein